MKILKYTPAVLAFFLLFFATSIHAQLAPGPDRRDINAPYLAEDIDVGEWVQRFEVEGREVYDYRHDIIAAVGIETGQTVADVGAGTGLFVPLLAGAVGPEGQVYAVDIVPAFLEHIDEKIKEHGLHQVSTVLGSERSIKLPEHSLDMVFTSDAYHHFVYYEDMLSSVHRALKPDGQLIVVEFDVAPGRSPQNLVEHVGGSKEEFTRQIEENGFRLVEDFTVDGLEQTFMRRFVKR